MESTQVLTPAVAPEFPLLDRETFKQVMSLDLCSKTIKNIFTVHGKLKLDILEAQSVGDQQRANQVTTLWENLIGSISVTAQNGHSEIIGTLLDVTCYISNLTEQDIAEIILEDFAGDSSQEDAEQELGSLQDVQPWSPQSSLDTFKQPISIESPSNPTEDAVGSIEDDAQEVFDAVGLLKKVIAISEPSPCEPLSTHTKVSKAKVNAYTVWSPDEIVQLTKEHADGMTVAKMALEHKRSQGSIRTQLNKLHLKVQRQTCKPRCKTSKNTVAQIL